MTTRRNVIKTLGIGSALLMASTDTKLMASTRASDFKFCLNTSTISGTALGVKKYIEIASKAGYDGIELWIRDIEAYLNDGNTVQSLKKIIADNNIKVENAIGFAPWMAEDEKQQKAGFDQMKKEMEVLAEIGCMRVAAPAIGTTVPLDLFRAGESYRELIALGRSTGVMPQLEFWGAFPPFHHLGQTLMVAAVANDSDARILADVYHLFRGGSGFEGLKMLNGNLIEIFHMNDFVNSIPREQQEDKDRVYPGDGAAPMQEIVRDLKNMGGTKILSLELFNRGYWEQDPLEVAKTGLEKMKKLV